VEAQVQPVAEPKVAAADAAGQPESAAAGEGQQPVEGDQAATSEKEAAWDEEVKATTESPTPTPDPERKPSLRPLQRQGQDLLVAQTYGDLFEELKLTDSEKARFSKILLLKPQFSGSTGSEPEALAQTIRSFLGEDRYAVYQNYEATVPGRWLLAQYRQGLESLGRPLTADQQEQLLNVVIEERQGLAPVTAANPIVDLAKMPDQMAENLAKQQESNAAILRRAAGFLDAAQLAGLKEMERRREESDRRSIEAYRQIFQVAGPQAPAAAPAAE
jgi:hypothetical protein